MPESLPISAIRTDSSPTGHRVTACVGGADVWFECEDAALAPSLEAVVAAFLIPSLALGAPLAAPPSLAAAPDFLNRLGTIRDVAARWWRYAPIPPDVTAAARAVPCRPRRTALCFSGGADSFHTLLASGRRVDDLVFVHGFDIALDDTARAAACAEHVRAVARAAGARALVVRTNLRRHAIFRRAPWERTHGGALAALGHLLVDSVDTLLISASFPYRRWRAWGSHWELDPHWGGNGLTVEHVGAECSRVDKLRALANEPLAQAYLRVCWENRSPSLNCSRCEKCIRTQVILAALGVLDRFTAFEAPGTLVERVDAVPRIRDPIIFQRYEAALEIGAPPAIDRAVRRLLARSRRALRRERLLRARELAGTVARRLLRRTAG